jgi:iron-sulfur cluster repair protein YtfE (RIC family)
VIRGFVAKIDAILQPPYGDAAWAKKLADLVLFGTAGLRFHHQVEDEEFWPALVAKGVDPSVLEPLQVAHRELDPLLDRLEAEAHRLQTNPGDASIVASLAASLPGFRGHVHEHLAEEEPIIFPLLERHISNDEAHAIARRVSKKAPKKGISWLMGGVANAMTPDEAKNFLSAFPPPLLWLRPLFLRTYRRNCVVLGLTPDFPT